MKNRILKILGIIVVIVILLQTVVMAASTSELEKRKNDNKQTYCKAWFLHCAL